MIKGNTVLLVEDEIETREPLKDEFESNGFKVLEAGSVTDALKLIEDQTEIDAIILDMKMPETLTDNVEESAGVKVLRAALHYGLAKATVPIIVFTGYESYPSCVASMKAGAYDYIPKGIVDKSTTRELVRLCRKAIQQCRMEPEALSDTWLDRNYEKLAKKFGGKRIAVVPLEMYHAKKIPDSIEMDGCMVVAADTYEGLRIALMDDPILRDSLPFIAFVPGEQGGEY